MNSGWLNESNQPTAPRRRGASSRVRDAASVNGRPPLDHFVHSEGENDDATERVCLYAWIDPQQIHRVRQNLQEADRPRHHLNCADSALQADTGDDARHDDFQRRLPFDDHLAQAELRGEREAGNGDQVRAAGLGGYQLGLGTDARYRRRLRIAEVGEEIAAHAGESLHEPHEGDNCRSRISGSRQLEL